ncbi:RING finger protein [Paramyrothecium foliicola]|nr:RING finger protein [Paramyrothecium foliicola]
MIDVYCIIMLKIDEFALTEIRNVVLLFSNPVWSGANTVPTTIVRNITALSSQLAYQDSIFENLTTLSTTNADTLNGVIRGLIYVPDVQGVAACDVQQYDFIPRNVTRQADLPPMSYPLIALAPWFSQDCTMAYLAAAAFDPLRAFIFYKAASNSTNKPQEADSPVWDLDDDGAWRKQNKFPIFAIPSLEGQKLMRQMSYYSGSIEDTPHGEEITSLYGPNPRDYVRIWTELTMENPSNLPALWTFFLIIIGALLFMFGAVSCLMHFFQRRRRKSLERQVRSGEVDLEAMGVKRLTVPPTHVASFPLYTYTSEPATAARPNPPPSSVGAASSPRSTKSSSRSRRPTLRSTTSDTVCPSIRSKRSSLAVGAGDNTATNDQPECQICLVEFEHRSTIIRNLPCDHIFHPECIDEFLTQNSSLCPICKHCMLPRGYSPRITDGMVRRERALRRLRERVNLDDTSLDSEESKIKAWGRRFLTFSPLPSTQPRLPMTPVTPRRPATTSSAKSVSAADSASYSATAPASGPTPAPAKKPRSRGIRPRPLRVLPTQPEDAELKVEPQGGRGSPSSFARERMRAIAARNAPFDDPDQNYPTWRRAFGKVFPGLF